MTRLSHPKNNRKRTAIRYLCIDGCRRASLVEWLRPAHQRLRSGTITSAKEDLHNTFFGVLKLSNVKRGGAAPRASRDGFPENAPAYTEAIGEALGIIGPDSIDEDPATLTPEISLRSSGGQVEVVWNKGSQEGVEIQKDSGNGQWTFLALDTRPNYIDTTPMPATSAKWKYRAIYSNDAQRTGQWSNVAEIVVGG